MASLLRDFDGFLAVDDRDGGVPIPDSVAPETIARWRECQTAWEAQQDEIQQVIGNR